MTNNILLHVNTIIFLNIDEISSSLTYVGLSRSLTNLIDGESLMTSVISLIIYSAVVRINFQSKHVNHTLGKDMFPIS